MPELTFDLHLTAEKLLAYYRGDARVVHARATNGQTLQFPASALQRLVTPDGIHGRFRIVFDANRKFERIERVEG